MYIRAALLGAEMVGGGAADEEAAVEVHVDDGEPVLRRHLVEDRIAQDAGVVHHDIDAPETVEGALHDPLGAGPFGDAVAADGRAPAALRDDLLRLRGRRFGFAVAGE